MTDISKVVPPQPRLRMVTRRVKARRFTQVTLILGVWFVASVLFGYDDLVSRQSGFYFWFAFVVVAVMFVCALMAGIFLLTEQPKQVEALENPLSGTRVIHLTPKS